MSPQIGFWIGLAIIAILVTWDIVDMRRGRQPEQEQDSE